MAGSTLVNVDVSQDTFEEIANALEAQGQKVNPDAPITITKNIKIKGPINYRQVAVRKDVLEYVKDIYKTPITNDFEVSNASHFIDFLDAIYTYVLKGEKPKSTPEPIQTAKPKNAWEQ